MAHFRIAAHSTEPPPIRKGMLAAGAADRGEDDLELATKLATIALSSPLIRRLNSEVLRYVTRSSRVLKARAGQLLAKPGERSDGLMVILRGHVGLESSGEQSASLHSLGPGEFCAAEPIISGAPALAQLRAKTDVEILVIPYGVARILSARDATLEDLTRTRVMAGNLSALLSLSDCLRSPELGVAVAKLADRASFITLPGRECILADGILSDSVYLLASGAVEIAVPHPRLGYEDVRRDRVGSLLGRCSLLGITERAATWTTPQTCLLQVPRRILDALVKDKSIEVLIPRPSVLERDAA